MRSISFATRSAASFSFAFLFFKTDSGVTFLAGAAGALSIKRGRKERVAERRVRELKNKIPLYRVVESKIELFVESITS